MTATLVPSFLFAAALAAALLGADGPVSTSPAGVVETRPAPAPGGAGALADEQETMGAASSGPAGAAAASRPPSAATSQEASSCPGPGSPLAPLARLVGGGWYLEGTVQRFTWGPGCLSLRSEQLAVTPAGEEPVASGMWLWHPGTGEVRGWFVAAGMPFQVMEMTTRTEAPDILVHEATAYAADGTATRLRETWTFLDEDHYRWELERVTDGGAEPWMEAVLERRRERRRDEPPAPR